MLLIVGEYELAAGPTIEAVVVLTVLLSTFAHGMTAFPLSRRYGAWLSRAHEDMMQAERAEAQELPARIRHADGYHGHSGKG